MPRQSRFQEKCIQSSCKNVNTCPKVLSKSFFLPYPVSIDVIPMHHDLKLFVDLVVLGLGPRSEVGVHLGVRVAAIGTPGGATLILLFIQGLKT